MSEQNKSDDKSSLTTPTIAVIALLLGFFATQDTIFNKTRPAMIDTERTSTEDVRSRLWQDPFHAVAQYRKENGENNTKPPEKSEPDQHALDNFYEEIKNNRKSVHVLAVMVPGGPYAENQEWRLRSRYALISGMYAAGYVPEDPEHIGFVDFKNAKNTKDTNGHRKLDFPDYMPYEWFELDKDLETVFRSATIEKSRLLLSDRRESVLVLWLNNDVFAQSENSLAILGKLKKAILSNSKAIDFTIIGPHDSDTLKKMYVEASTPPPHLLAYYPYLIDSHLFSASATVDNRQLETTEQTTLRLSLPDVNWLKNKIIRTISTEDKLANTLFCELALRGITPSSVQLNVLQKNCGSISGFVLGGTKTNHIVLIGESDTFYSRGLTKSLLKEINNFDINSKSYQTYTINYLRGLDGITSERITVDQDNQNKESQTNKPNNQKSKEQLERPTGTSQLDYLVRLAEQIKYLDKINDKDGGIKAIGITGSDTYDKLLILQALRPKFPETLFFTTDLDARLFHPSEIKWTRNLIVASPFGLWLNDDWQINTPPFRDSYQTALYFTTLLALLCPHTEEQCSNSSLKKYIEELQINPRLFEIGNKSAVDLSHKVENGENGIHPEPENTAINRITPDKIASIIVALCMLMLFLLYLLPQALRPIISIISLSAICLIIIHYNLSPLDAYGLEPVSFTNGTSVWPANGIRMIASLLSGYFIYSIIKQLINQDDKVKANYLPPGRRNPPKSKETKNLLPWFFIDQWHLKISNKNKLINFAHLWFQYLELRKLSHWSTARIIYMLGLFGFFGWLLTQAGFIIPEGPFRGENSYYATKIILSFAVAAYLILTFVIADITRLTSHFIKELALCNIYWPQKTIYEHNRFGLIKNAVKNKILINFIHQQANAINNFIYYPSIILFLLIVSRTHFFDNWQISPLLLFIYIFTALITLGSAIRLRKASEDARRCILEKLDKLLSDQHVLDSAEKSTQIKSLINEIKDLKDGVFQPLSHHPIALSLLIPFSSIAGVSLLEYFAFSAS